MLMPATTGSGLRQVYASPSGTWDSETVHRRHHRTVVSVIPCPLRQHAFTSDGGIDGATPAGSWVLTGAQAIFFAGLAAWPLVAAWRKSAGWRKAYGFVISRAVGIGIVGGFVTLTAMVVLTNVTATLLARQEVASAGADAAEVDDRQHLRVRALPAADRDRGPLRRGLPSGPGVGSGR